MPAARAIGTSQHGCRWIQQLWLAAPLVIGAAVAHPAVAQITAATLSGIVTDDSGAPLPRVEVTLKNLETGLSRSTVTNDAGSYTIPGLPPGVYETRASLSGFATAVQSGIVLTVGQEAGLNLTLKVGAAEQLVVVGASAIVDTKGSALSAVVGEKTIEDLPLNGRNFLDLAVLQPGVAGFLGRSRGGAGVTGLGQQLDINGGNGRANSYLLDGANMNGYPGLSVATAASSTLGVDMIREFRIVTNAFPADYGRAMGGVVSIVTKSGTNELHGSGFEFFRNDALDARNFFDVDKPPFERHQFGATSGGPLHRNRTFFFGGAEGLVENLGQTQVTEVPSMQAREGPVAPVVRPYLDLFPAPNGPNLGEGLARFTFPFDRTTREAFVQARIDHNASGASALFVRYTVDTATRRQPTLLPEFSTDLTSGNQWLTVEEKHILTRSLLNTARFSYSRIKLAADLVNDMAGPDLSFVPGSPIVGNLLIASREYGPERTNPQHQDAAFLTISDDVTYSRGRHLLKGGVLIERVHTDTENSTSVRGRYTFPNVQRFLEGIPSRFTGVRPGYELSRSRRNTVFGFYLQDDLTASPRLTLNLGLRYEFYTVPNDVNGRDSALRNIATDGQFAVGPIFENPSLKNIGPRVGFAWDVAGDGKSSVRGGIGVYYDTDGPFNSALLAAAFSPPFAQSINIANPEFPHPSLERATFERAARGLDYHVAQPRMVTGNIGLQRELLPRLVITAAYAGSRGYNLVQAIEGNPVVPQVLADGRLFFPEGAPRQNPAWESIDFRTTGGRSWYHALQLDASRRFSQGHRFQMSYTLGKTIDETQGQVGADSTNSSVFPQNPIDPRNDRARADFDVRHVFTTSFTWVLPFADSMTGAKGALVRGWQINALALLRSGIPFSPAIQTQNNWSRSGNVAPGAEDRPNLRPGVRLEDIVRGGPTQYFDPAAFELQPPGFLGNVERNLLTGPGLATFNVAFVKHARWQSLGPRGAIELRIEAFNALNAANFGIPNRVVFGAASQGDRPLPTAGQITSTATDARQVQLGMKFRF